jgi:alkylhydroperoxidase/carboxymuconolactone decarboxylase family protein YurZ
MSRFTSNYSWLESTFGKAMEAHQEFGKALREAGPLCDKDAQLIQLAGAAAIRSEGGVHSHAKRALDAGAQPGEIYHTVLLLASTIGFPATAAALSWAREIVGE